MTRRERCISPLCSIIFSGARSYSYFLNDALPPSLAWWSQTAAARRVSPQHTFLHETTMLRHRSYLLPACSNSRGPTEELLAYLLCWAGWCGWAAGPLPLPCMCIKQCACVTVCVCGNKVEQDRSVLREVCVCVCVHARPRVHVCVYQLRAFAFGQHYRCCSSWGFLNVCVEGGGVGGSQCVCLIWVGWGGGWKLGGSVCVFGGG